MRVCVLLALAFTLGAQSPDATARRLNRYEYNATVRDLLAIPFEPAADFPVDDSGYGFDNIADVLSLSPALMEKYLAAAEKIARAAIVPPTPPQPSVQRFAASDFHFKVDFEGDYEVLIASSAMREAPPRRPSDRWRSRRNPADRRRYRPGASVIPSAPRPVIRVSPWWLSGSSIFRPTELCRIARPLQRPSLRRCRKVTAASSAVATRRDITR